MFHILQISLGAGFALLDSAAVRMVRQYNGEYSRVLFWQMLASASGPYIAGLLIEESTDPLGKLM